MRKIDISQISTTWRSGSTFLGDVLLAHPATYYHYEPLIHYGIKQVRSGLLDGLLAEDAIRVLKNVLNCNYNELGRHRTVCWIICQLSLTFRADEVLKLSLSFLFAQHFSTKNLNKFKILNPL